MVSVLAFSRTGRSENGGVEGAAGKLQAHQAGVFLAQVFDGAVRDRQAIESEFGLCFQSALRQWKAPSPARLLVVPFS